MDRARASANFLGTALVLAACGETTGASSGGSTSGGSSGARGDPTCERACARCAGDPCDNCALYTNLWRSEYRDALFACVADPSATCDARWQACASEGAKLPARESDDVYRERCRTKRTLCADGFSETYCTASVVLTADWVETAHACTEQSCDDVALCLRAIFEPK